MAYLILVNGEWVQTDKPSQGQFYRHIDPAGGTVDSFWSESETEQEPYKITRLAFRQRFTLPERVAIETAAETNATVRVMLKDQEAATFIDLSRQDTIDGVNYLTTVMQPDELTPLISSFRANEILTAPIQSTERF